MFHIPIAMLQRPREFGCFVAWDDVRFVCGNASVDIEGMKFCPQSIGVHRNSWFLLKLYAEDLVWFLAVFTNLKRMDTETQSPIRSVYGEVSQLS